MASVPISLSIPQAGTTDIGGQEAIAPALLDWRVCGCVIVWVCGRAFPMSVYG